VPRDVDLDICCFPQFFTASIHVLDTRHVRIVTLFTVRSGKGSDINIDNFMYPVTPCRTNQLQAAESVLRI
jgi:hypothetical protein